MVKDFVQQAHLEVQEFYERIGNLISGFEGLGIEFEELNPFTAELGILIPKRENKDTLDYFSKDIKELNNELQVFHELTTGSASKFKINSISSSDFSIFIDMLPATIHSVVTVVHQIILAYEGLLDIRIRIEEYRKSKAPNNVIDSMEEWAQGVMEKQIEQTTKELLKQFKDVKREDGRLNELQTAVKFSCKKLAGRIDVGYNFSARIGEPPASEDEDNPTPEEEEQRQLVESVENSASEIGYRKPGEEPVLPIKWQPNGDTDESNNDDDAK